MTTSYAFIQDLARAMEIPQDGTLSRTVYQDDSIKAVLFGFDAGQELSEHTSARPALIHMVQGEAELTLGNDAHRAQAGTWVHMPAGLAHSVKAVTPLVMLLILLPGE